MESRVGGGGWRVADVHREEGRETIKREAAGAAAAEHQKQYGLLATLIRSVWLEVRGSGFPRHRRRAFSERPRLLLSAPSQGGDREGGGAAGDGGRVGIKRRDVHVTENQRQPVIAFFFFFEECATEL